MEAIHSLLLGFQVFLTPYNNVVAVLIPMTFRMPPNSAIILLAAIYWGGLFGGVITSILFNIPGEPWSVATCFDGYPMAKKCQAGEVLTTSFVSHLFVAVFATLMLTFFAPVVAEFSLRFGPPEIFAVMMLTFSGRRDDDGPRLHRHRPAPHGAREDFGLDRRL